MRLLSAEDLETRKWASPGFGVPKKNGDMRLVFDFRRLNQWRERNEYPLPTIDEILSNIKGFNLASVIDLSIGYLSIPLTEETKELLIITTPFGFYECQSLSMGVIPATEIFQARMVDIFQPMMAMKPDPYIDGILHCKGDTFNEHLDGLNEILRRLKEAGIQVNLAKSKLCAKNVNFWASHLVRQDASHFESASRPSSRSRLPRMSRKSVCFCGRSTL